MGNNSRRQFTGRLALVSGLLGLTGCTVQVDTAAQSFRQSAPITSEIARDRQQENRLDESSVLPVLLIDLNGTPIVEGRETTGELKVIADHDGSLEDLSRSPISLHSAVAVEVHGETSARLAKKSYQLELVDDARNDRAQALLDLPPGSDWILHGCGADRTCLRNVLTYALAREFGQYAPRTRFVELVLDGSYQGIYVLLERVRRGTNRVDLPRPSDTVADGDITGGYVFKMDLAEGRPGDRVPRDWVSPRSQTVYSYYYPRFNQITAAQRAYLHDYVSRFEAVMHGAAWSDPETGYRRWLDVSSWVDFALLQELSVNPDAYFKSVYLQKWPQSKGDKIAIGPVWDFDLAFGMADFRGARDTAAWAFDMNRFGRVGVPNYPGRDAPFVPVHWERLWSDQAFRQDVQCRWQDLRTGPLQLGTLHALIDGWVDQLAVAQPRDGALWGNPPANAYAGEVASLKEFLGKRVAWMDANLPGSC